CGINPRRGQSVAEVPVVDGGLVAVGGEAGCVAVRIFCEVCLGEEPAIPLEAPEGVTGDAEREAGLVGHDIGCGAAVALLPHRSAAAIVHDHWPRLRPDSRVNVHLAAAEDQPHALAACILWQHERALALCQRDAITAAAEIPGPAILFSAWAGPLALGCQGKREQDHDSPPIVETMS